MFPPRLLLGIALLFWGGMTGRPIPGLALALLVEGAHWTRIRWDFGERAFLRAWRLCVLLLVIVAVLVLMDGARLDAMLRVFTWMPVILLPLQFVQSYGMSRTMTLATFSLMIRRRQAHALKHGLAFRKVGFSFGSVYLAAILLSSSIGRNADSPIFFPGLVLLGGWALVSATHSALFPALSLLSLSFAGGLVGQEGLSALHRYAIHGGSSGGDDEGMQSASTAMGRLGDIKQSPEIRWRLKPVQGKLPTLIRNASYATLFGDTWRSIYLPDSIAEDLGAKRIPDDFSELTVFGNPANPEDPEDTFRLAAPEIPALEAIDPSLPRFILRGEVENRATLIPAPGGASAFHRFPVQELQRSSFGAFRLTPADPVVNTTILWNEKLSTEKPPWSSTLPARKAGESPASFLPDLQIPSRTKDTLAQIADEIDLRDGNLNDRVMKLRVWFLKNFQYTRHNSVPRRSHSDDGLSLLERFLLKTRAGHCEFFATASVMLLREAGIPARYTTGFAVVEFDNKRQEAIIRGIHAHAWCRAWDEASGRWIDVDLTPPDWTGIETPRMSRFQGLRDRLQFLRQDLLVWRSQPGNMLLVTVCLLTPLLIGLAFLMRNLWRSKRRLDDPRRRRHARTALSDLEKPARRLLGERPPGQPLAAWLGQLAPRLGSPEALAEALALHQRLRFDPNPPDPQWSERLAALVVILKAGLSRLPKSP